MEEDAEAASFGSLSRDGLPRRREVDAIRQVQVSPSLKFAGVRKTQTLNVPVLIFLLLLALPFTCYLCYTWYSATAQDDLVVAQKRFLLEMETQPLQKTIIVHDQTTAQDGENVDGPEISVNVFKYQQPNLTVNLCAIVFAQLASLSKPCVLWSQNGVATTSYTQLTEQQSYYVFLKERLFLWPVVGKGFRQQTTVKGISGVPIELETLSLRPRIFRVYNYISLQDVQIFLDQSKQLTMTRSTGGLRRKDTNAGDEISTRTSQNAWDTDSAHSRRLKDLAMDLLRIPHHDVEFLDGFQIVRYDPGQSYITHSDWFGVDSGRGWNWDPARGGVNRWATLFLYLSNVTLGGETMFPLAGDMPPTDNFTQEQIDVIKKDLFLPGAWENGIVDECRTKFRVIPAIGEAILFYHQSSIGKLDEMAQHAACPVLVGEKTGANLWIWNDKRWSAARVEVTEQLEEEEINEGKRTFLATFHNEFGAVDVFWVGSEEVFQFSSDKGQQTGRNTWKDHQFVVRERGGENRVVARFVMDPKTTHTYTIISGEL